eukprot:13435488-Alexandrium_andersonii.AAC.1
MRWRSARFREFDAGALQRGVARAGGAWRAAARRLRKPGGRTCARPSGRAQASCRRATARAARHP